MKNACTAVLRRNHGIYWCNLPEGHDGAHVTGSGELWIERGGEHENYNGRKSSRARRGN